MITFIGEPLNGIYFGEETFSYPTGQAETYRKVLRESESRDLVESALCREYQAIISALKRWISSSGFYHRIPDRPTEALLSDA